MLRVGWIRVGYGLMLTKCEERGISNGGGVGLLSYGDVNMLELILLSAVCQITRTEGGVGYGFRLT